MVFKTMYLSIIFMHLSHLYGIKVKIKTYIFFHFLSYCKPNKGILLFSFPLLSLFPNIDKISNLFSFLSYFLSIIHFFSPLFPHVCNQTKHKCPILLYTLSKLRNGCFCFYPLNTLRKSIFQRNSLYYYSMVLVHWGPYVFP